MRASLASLASLVFAAIGAVTALAATGCSELSRFTTSPDQSYCGVVTGASFVRSDALAEGTKMRLQLDVDGLESTPGTLWTGDLAPKESFVATPLRAIKQLPADALSTLQFGEGSLKSSIAIAELNHTEVVVVISLMQSGDVVVRLMRGDGQATWADGTPKPPQIFGVFNLAKTPGDCGPLK